MRTFRRTRLISDYSNAYGRNQASAARIDKKFTRRVGGDYVAPALNWIATSTANDPFMERVNLTGTADTRLMTVSLWFKRAENFPVTETKNILGVADFQRFEIVLMNEANSNVLRCFGSDSSGTIIIRAESNAAITDNKWHHLLWSFNLTSGESSSTQRLYIDDVSDLNEITYTSGGTIDLVSTPTDFRIGASRGAVASLKWRGGLSEIWFSTSEYLDFDTISNRRLFISHNKLPIFLGEKGDRPTGNSPPLYIRMKRTDDVTPSVMNNRGTGGDFTTFDNASSVNTSAPMIVFRN